MTTPGTMRERPTHCKGGHEFTPKNTRINRNADGSFRQYVCRKCAAEAQRRAVERKRESGEWEDHLAARRERERAGRAESAKIHTRRKRDELAEKNRQDEQEAIMAQARDHAHVAAGPFPIADPLVRVPAACRRGHELTARTVHLSTRVVDGETVPGGVECIRCLREDCYRAHYRMPRAAPVLPEILDEAEFMRQPCGTGHVSRRAEPWPTDAGWWTRIEFASGWGYCDPDPTPELRATREAAREADQNEREAADAARVAAELDELELRDARLRREQRARTAAASTPAIRAAMSAARGGVA